jgi:DNA-binding NarL/FixJ family response regulator
MTSQRVVFFEDEPQYHESLIEWLSGAYDFVPVKTPKGLVRELKGAKPLSLLILDLMAARGDMRDRRGRTFALRDTGLVILMNLRAGDYGDTNRNCPVIVFSGRHDTGSHRVARDCNVAYYHVKGNPLEELETAVDRILGKS